jgi:hypothetical protein
MDCRIKSGNDEIQERPRDAPASELCEPQRRARKNLPPPKGGGAPIGAPSMTARSRQECANLRNSSAARQRLGREPLAFRRSAAALARANASAVGSAPVPAFPETRLDGCYPLSPVSSLPSSSETGRRAGRAVAQSRPGAVCETARGHRTRSASRSHPECALRRARFDVGLVTKTETFVKRHVATSATSFRATPNGSTRSSRPDDKLHVEPGICTSNGQNQCQGFSAPALAAVRQTPACCQALTAVSRARW